VSLDGLTPLASSHALIFCALLATTWPDSPLCCLELEVEVLRGVVQLNAKAHRLSCIRLGLVTETFTRQHGLLRKEHISRAHSRTLLRIHRQELQFLQRQQPTPRGRSSWDVVLQKGECFVAIEVDILEGRQIYDICPLANYVHAGACLQSRASEAGAGSLAAGTGGQNSTEMVNRKKNEGGAGGLLPPLPTLLHMQWEPKDNEFYEELSEDKLVQMTRDDSIPEATRHAVDFTIHTDDGARPDKIEEADIILVGVSGSTKTTLANYLAKHYGYKVGLHIPACTSHTCKLHSWEDLHETSTFFLEEFDLLQSRDYA
jgi:hypothetical protein